MSLAELAQACAPPCPRTATFTAELNWKCVENGPACPKPSSLCTLFLRIKERCDYSLDLKVVAAEFIKLGYYIRPYDENRDDKYEREVFADESSQEVVFNLYTGNESQVRVDVSESVGREHVEKVVIPALRKRFGSLGGPCVVDHQRRVEKVDGVTFVAITGTEDGKFGGTNASGRISTLFSLAVDVDESKPREDTVENNDDISRSNDSKCIEIAKGLWTYENGEMSHDGPTLEFLEVASEWRRRGIGALFYGYMELYILEPFKKFKDIAISACYVTDSNAGRFFCSTLGFRDADGMMEELMKRLEYVDNEWVPNLEDECEGQAAVSRLDRFAMLPQLAAYNTKHGMKVEGREVRGDYMKPCTKCGDSYFYGNWYYTNPGRTLKWCQDCTAKELDEDIGPIESSLPPVFAGRPNAPWICKFPGYLGRD